MTIILLDAYLMPLLGRHLRPGGPQSISWAHDPPMCWDGTDRWSQNIIHAISVEWQGWKPDCDHQCLATDARVALVLRAQFVMNFEGEKQVDLKMDESSPYLFCCDMVSSATKHMYCLKCKWKATWANNRLTIWARIRGESPSDARHWVHGIMSS